MRHIAPTQLRDLSSQAFVLVDLSKKLNKDSNGSVAIIKKNSAKNLLATALGYTSWSHLTMTTKGKADCTDFVQVFSRIGEACAFFENRCLLETVYADQFTSNMSWNSGDNCPFVAEVCQKYDVEVSILKCHGLDDIYTLSDSDSMFHSALYFESKVELEMFLQRNIEIVRSGYIAIGGRDSAFERLLDKKAEEVSATSDAMMAVFDSHESIRTHFLDFMSEKFIGSYGIRLAEKDDILTEGFFFWLVKKYLGSDEFIQGTFDNYYEPMFKSIEKMSIDGDLKHSCFIEGVTMHYQYSLPEPKTESIIIYLPGAIRATIDELETKVKVAAFSTAVCVSASLNGEKNLTKSEARSLAKPYFDKAVLPQKSSHQLEIVYLASN